MGLFGRALTQTEKAILANGALSFVALQEKGMFKNVDTIEYGFKRCLPEVLNAKNVRKISGDTWLAVLNAYARYDAVLDIMLASPQLDANGRKNIRGLQDDARTAAELMRRIIKTETSFRPKEYRVLREEQMELLHKDLKDAAQSEPSTKKADANINYDLVNDCVCRCLVESDMTHTLYGETSDTGLAKCYAAYLFATKNHLRNYNESISNAILSEHTNCIKQNNRSKWNTEELISAVNDHKQFDQKISFMVNFSNTFENSQGGEAQKVIVNALASLGSLVNDDNIAVITERLFAFLTDLTDMYMKSIGIKDMLMPSGIDARSKEAIINHYHALKTALETNTNDGSDPSVSIDNGEAAYQSFINVVNLPGAYDAMIDDIRNNLNALGNLGDNLYNTTRKELFSGILNAPLGDAVIIDLLNYMIWVSSLDGKVDDKEAILIYDVFRMRDITKSYIESLISDNKEFYAMYEDSVPPSFLAFMLIESLMLKAGKVEEDHKFLACRSYYSLLKGMGGLVIACDKDLHETEVRRLDAFLEKLKTDFKKESGYDLDKPVK